MRFLGIDLGTSSIKCSIYDEFANKIYDNSIEYDIIVKNEGYAEEDPKIWVDSLFIILKDIGNKYGYVDALSFSGQMHGLVLLDKNDNVLRDSIIWCDNRCKEEYDYINSIINNNKIKEITGNNIIPSFTLSKLIWVKRNEKDIYDKIKKVMLPKDYIRYVLTKKFYTDESDISGSQFININTFDYSLELLNALDIDINILPKIEKSTFNIGKIDDEISKLLNFKCDNVILGSGDQAAGAIGVGAIGDNDMSLVLGSSGVMLTQIKNEDIKKLENEVFISSNSKLFTMAVTNGCGLSYKWYANTLGGYDIDKYNKLNEEANNASPLSNGLIYLPYLNGERSPIKDLYAKGVFYGITPITTKCDFSRAILEGVGYSLKDCLNTLPKKEYNIYASGGGAKSKLWLEIISSMLNMNIYTLDVSDSATLGAAIIACVGINYYTFSEAKEKLIKIKDKFIPNQELVKLYDKGYNKYKDIYNSLKNVFRKD